GPRGDLGVRRPSRQRPGVTGSALNRLRGELTHSSQKEMGESSRLVANFRDKNRYLVDLHPPRDRSFVLMKSLICHGARYAPYSKEHGAASRRRDSFPGPSARSPLSFDSV